MANYRPTEAEQMTTPFKLQIPVYKVVSGVKKVDRYDDAKEPQFLASFKTFGGTEQDINGVIAIKDTGSVVCFYRPDIAINCKIINLTNNKEYKIISEPENTDERNQFLKFKVERLKGGA